MKPKRGEMTFEQNMACKELLLWEQEAHGVNYNLATREHLASMGLVTQAEYDALQTRYLDLVTKVEELREFAYEQEKPPPHVWSVGEYALCLDGKVHKVRRVEGYRLDFYDYGSQSVSNCTPCPEPEMPELNFGYFIDGDMIGYKNDFSRPIESWLLFLGEGSKEYAQLLALRDWRELTGRRV